MKAIVYHQYGTPDDLTLQDLPTPTPKENQILVKVNASSVNASDYVFLTGQPYVARTVSGLFKPKNPVLGRDIAGTVESVGANVTNFKPGDEVFAEIEGGAFAESALAPADKLVLKPINLDFQQAAAIPASGVSALQGFNAPIQNQTSPLQPGQRVLINGASGSVGTFAIQIAKAQGAHVTGICSTKNIQMVESLGADQVIDYTKTDATSQEETYDLILDFIGNHDLDALKSILTPKGAYVLYGVKNGSKWLGPVPRMIKMGMGSKKDGQRLIPLAASPNQADLQSLKELAESNQLTPQISMTYPLEKVPEALNEQGTGHSAGKLVITIP